MSAIAKKVKKGSLADLAGIVPGDKIEYINGKEVVDYLDYMYLTANDKIEISLEDRKVTI